MKIWKKVLNQSPGLVASKQPQQSSSIKNTKKKLEIIQIAICGWAECCFCTGGASTSSLSFFLAQAQHNGCV